MEKIEVFLSMAGAALTFLVTAVTFIIKFINAAKERNLKKIKDLAEEAVAYVEELKGKAGGDLTGEVKKQIALNRIENACVASGLKFKATQADEMIENLVALSKVVNKRNEDDAKYQMQQF